MSVANQRKILVKRSSESVRKDFFKISNKNLETAMYNLKGNAFKLYCYLCDNKDGYTMELYPIDFQRKANVSYDTYIKAFNLLKEKGYLLPSKTSKNTFMFVEASEIAEEIPEREDTVIISLDEEEFEIERNKDFT